MKYLWQLPQNLLGLIVLIITRAKKKDDIYIWKYNSGVSLGSYIFLPDTADETVVKHEKGHQKQSLYLGWLYLIVIGVPSFLWATVKQLGLFKSKSYYWFYTESWADKLAGIER